VVNYYKNHNFDYVSNIFPLPCTFPDGCNVEIFSINVLKRAHIEAKRPSDREHVTFFMWMQPEKYKIFRVDNNTDVSKYRLTLDYEEDYQVIKKVFEELYIDNSRFSMDDVISWLEKNPQVRKMNANIRPNQGWKKALEEDKTKGFKGYNFKEYVE